MPLFSVRKMFTSKVDNKVTLHAPRIYAVTLTYQGSASTQLKFNMEICRMTVGDDMTHYFQITRSAIRVNDEDTSDYIAADLAAQCGNVLYPLQIQIGQNGNMTGILNHQTILQRWQGKKGGLKQYFTGPDAHSYIDATDDTLSEESSLLSAIRHDLFLAAFFQVQFVGSRTAFKVPYHLFPFEIPVMYETTQTGNRVMNNLRQSGRQENGEGTMEIKYVFHRIHGLVQSLEAQWDADRQEQYLQITLTATCVNSDDHSIN